MPDLAASLPSTLRAAARWERLGPAHTPVLLAHPTWSPSELAPVMLWLHGRTVHKELDPGRYLRWIRQGIGVCAIDLPGHGERYDHDLQQPDRTLDVILAMIDEIDDIVTALRDFHVFDPDRIGIGGMSAGGMATLARLCRPHGFVCAAVEATTGSWEHQEHREMFRHRPDAEVAPRDPIRHLEHWREIPLQAIHGRYDEWIDVAGQRLFIESLRGRYRDPELIEYIEYDRTGAPFEHAGFGKYAADAKNRQRDFLVRWLRGEG